MKNKLLDSIINNIKQNKSYDNIKLKEIRYGLDVFLSTIFKITVIFIIAKIINVTKELGLLFLFYMLLRLTAFGVHAKKSSHCWISSIFIFISIPLLIKYLYIPRLIMIILSLFLLILIFKYAPADTEKRPLIRKKRRELYKLLATLTCLIYILYISLTNNLYLSNVLFFSILTETIFILPITYKIFGVKYNNYLYYKRKEGTI